MASGHRHLAEYAEAAPAQPAFPFAVGAQASASRRLNRLPPRRVPRPLFHAEWKNPGLPPVYPPTVGAQTARSRRFNRFPARRAPRPLFHAEWQKFTAPPVYPPTTVTQAPVRRRLNRFGALHPWVRRDRSWDFAYTALFQQTMRVQVVRAHRLRGLENPRVRQDRIWDVVPPQVVVVVWPPRVLTTARTVRGLRRTNRPAPHAEFQTFTVPPAYAGTVIRSSTRRSARYYRLRRTDDLWDVPYLPVPTRIGAWGIVQRPPIYLATRVAHGRRLDLPPSGGDPSRAPAVVRARVWGLSRPGVIPRRQWETVRAQVVTLIYPPAVVRAPRLRGIAARRSSRPDAPRPLTALAWPPSVLLVRRLRGLAPARGHRLAALAEPTSSPWPAAVRLARRPAVAVRARRSPHAEFQTFTVPPVWPPLAGQRRAFRGAPVVRGHRPSVTPEQPAIPGLPSVTTGRRLRGWRRVPRPLPRAEWFTLVFPPAYPPAAGQRRALRGAPVVRGRRPTVTPEQIPLAGLPAVLTGRRLRGWRIVPRPVPHAGWLSPIFPPAYPPQFVSTARVARGRTVVRSHRPDAPLPLTALAWPPNVVRAYRLRGLLRPPVLARREWEFYPARITPPNPPQILTTARTVRGLRRVPRPAPRAEWQTFTVAPVWPPRVVSTARIVRGLRRVPRPPAHAEWQAFTVPPSWPPDVLSTARTVRGLLRPSVLPRRLWVVPPFQAVAVTTYALSVVSARRPRGIGSVRGRRPDAPLPLTALAWPPPVLARVRPRLGPPARGRVAAAPVLELAAGWTRPPIARRAVAGLAPARSRVLGPVFVELAAGWTPIPPARRLRGWLRVRTARPEALPATVPVPSWPPEARQRALRAPLGARSRPGRLAVPPGPLVGSYAPTALLRPRRAGLLPTRPRRVETVAPPAPPAYPPQFVSTARTLRGLRRERRPWSHAERPPPPPTLAVYPPGIYRSVAPRVLPPRVAGYRTFVVPPGVAFSPAVVWVLGPLAERWALGALVERWETEPGTDRWDLGPLARRWNLDKLRRRWSDGPLGG